MEVNPVNQLASSPPFPSLDMVIETEVMQEEQPVKPQSKDHAGAVKKSNPGKEKKLQIKPVGKSTTVSSSERKGTLPSPQNDFVEPDSKKRCRPASLNNAGISMSNAFSILEESHSSKKQAVVKCSVDKSGSLVNQNVKNDPASSTPVSVSCPIILGVNKRQRSPKRLTVLSLSRIRNTISSSSRHV